MKIQFGVGNDCAIALNTANKTLTITNLINVDVIPGNIEVFDMSISKWIIGGDSTAVGTVVINELDGIPVFIVTLNKLPDGVSNGDNLLTFIEVPDPEALQNSVDDSGSEFSGQLTQGGEPLSETNPLPVKSSLPIGASTEAKQDVGNTSLSKIVDNTVIYYTEDVEEDTSNSTTYVGKQSQDGAWLVQKIVDTVVGTVTSTTIWYASIVNNATKTTYASAWTDRATLTYSEIKDLL